MLNIFNLTFGPEDDDEDDGGWIWMDDTVLIEE